MKDGELAEQGNHTALLEKDGIYAHMWKDYIKTTKWHVGNEVMTC